MASACVNNIAMSPESFSSAAYGWLSPRMSFSRDDDPSKAKPSSAPSASSAPPPPTAKMDTPETIQDSAADFEFRLGEDPTTMLPADELFSDGKLVPLLAAAVSKPSPPALVKCPTSPESRSHRRTREASISAAAADTCLFSPKAPRCSSRWRELLGLRKLNPNSTNHKTTPSNPSTNPNPKSLKHFLHRTSRSNTTTTTTATSSSSASNSSPFFDHSLNLPLLKDAAVSVSDCESISISSSRLSLSSSSSGHDPHDDLPRLSLDAELGPNPFLRNPNPPRVRMARKSPNPGLDELHSLPARAVSADSPRMNSSGKIVFQSLERSSSSPSSFNGSGNGGRIKHRGMERSYSANVRVTPVLNVPVCSLRGSSKSGSVFGFGQLFSTSSPQKREPAATGGSSKHSSNSRNRTDRN